MSLAPETSQEEMSWLKEEAPLNMLVMATAEETSQEEMSWLKEVASRNM